MNYFNKNLIVFTLVMTCMFWGSQAFATAGYFALGYGAKSSAMAGATVAAPQDAMAGAVNPAGMALVGKRLELDLRAFNPERNGSLDPTVAGGSFKVKDKSDESWFFIPGVGITLPITDDLWLGLTIYGNGGMNTMFSRNIYDETAAVLGAFAVGGAEAAASVTEGTGTGSVNTGRLGIDLAQAIMAPTIAFKIHPKHSIGVSALISAQSFESKGLGNFQCFTPTGVANNPTACSPGAAGSATPGFVGSKRLSDNGRDWAYGVGARIGWVGEILPQLSLGAAVTSKIYMSEFSDYEELFAEKGRFDIPAHFQVGIALRPIENLQLAFDYQRIYFSGVNSVGNKGPVASPFGPTIPSGSGLLGLSNGLGFRWQDINVYRIGANYQLNKALSFRAGYSWNESPIPDDEILFNILSPASITRHLTAGISYRPNKYSEWNLSYVHALHENQTSRSSAFGVPASFSMHQNSIFLGFSWKY